VAANYRAVCRARPKAEFIAKLGVVVEEADETVFWLELLVETGIIKPGDMQNLLVGANELLAIFAASQHTARKALNQRTSDSNGSVSLARDFRGSAVRTERH
jgi:four helix bundle protein